MVVTSDPAGEFVFRYPEDTLEPGEYQILVTCTPYGINSHRLLVRGHRVDAAQEETVVSKEVRRADKRMKPLLIFAAAAFTETGTLTVCLQDQNCEAELAVYRVADYCNGAFERLPAGMYLVMQIPHAGDRVTAQTFLIGVPYRESADSEIKEENVLLYDVKAFPKVEETTSVPETPEEPKASEIAEEPSASIEKGDTSGRMLMVCVCLCLVSGAVIRGLKKCRLLK